MSKTKRSKYPAKFKLKAIKFAEKSNKLASGREYGVSEKLVRDWRRDAEKIKQCQRTRWNGMEWSGQWNGMNKGMELCDLVLQITRLF